METNDIVSKLREPFPATDIKKRPDGFDYIDQENITSRLLDATGGVFDVVINDGPKLVTYPKMKTGESKACWLAVVTITIPGLGSRTNVGTADTLNEDSPKGAVTDAIKKAATLFGCGLQLYEKTGTGTNQGQGNAQGRQGGQAPVNRQTRTAAAPASGQPSINDTGTQCAYCHAPNLKPHQRSCPTLKQTTAQAV